VLAGLAIHRDKSESCANGDSDKSHEHAVWLMRSRSSAKAGAKQRHPLCASAAAALPKKHQAKDTGQRETRVCKDAERDVQGEDDAMGFCRRSGMLGR